VDEVRLLQVLGEAARAVRAALDGLDDWGPAGTRPGQYRLDLAADAAALPILHGAGLDRSATSDLGQILWTGVLDTWPEAARATADRVSAAPGVRDYGLLSATAQMNAQVENLFTLPPSAFSPPPEVYSTVLRLHFAPRFAELGVDAAGFNSFLRRCFAQKRKTLQNNLRAAGYSVEQLSSTWPASIPAQARAESLALEPMAELYRSLSRAAVLVTTATSE